MKELMIYMKTTETCQLNCEHCFTNGRFGKKIYFNPTEVISWFKRLKRYKPNIGYVHVEFHGGEPFLAPVSHMRRVWLECKDLWPNMRWSACTNLVFNLTNERLKFIKEAFNYTIATSWDDGIRFENKKQEDLWRNNVKTLVDEGFDITLMVSLSKKTIEKEPIELLQFASELGIKWIQLERLTPYGSAKSNSHIFPSNIEMDDWFLRMWKQSVEHSVYEWAPKNLFLNSILDKIISGNAGGVFCRNCEQKMFTLNPDGSIGGCPNSAPEDNFGTLNDNIFDLFFNPGRMKNIACETHRNEACYSCPVFDICNGDCHQVLWQDNICASPKSMIRFLKENQDIELFKKFLKE